MLRDCVNKRVAIVMMTKGSSRQFNWAIVTGIIRTSGASLILDRGPKWPSLAVDEELLQRFKPPPKFMRHMFRDAELILAVGVSRLPADADCVIPLWLDVGEPSLN